MCLMLNYDSNVAAVKNRWQDCIVFDRLESKINISCREFTSADHQINYYTIKCIILMKKAC